MRAWLIKSIVRSSLCMVLNGLNDIQAWKTELINWSHIERLFISADNRCHYVTSKYYTFGGIIFPQCIYFRIVLVRTSRNTPYHLMCCYSPEIDRTSENWMPFRFMLFCYSKVIELLTCQTRDQIDPAVFKSIKLYLIKYGSSSFRLHGLAPLTGFGTVPFRKTNKSSHLAFSIFSYTLTNSCWILVLT